MHDKQNKTRTDKTAQGTREQRQHTRKQWVRGVITRRKTALLSPTLLRVFAYLSRGLSICPHNAVAATFRGRKHREHHTYVYIYICMVDG